MLLCRSGVPDNLPVAVSQMLAESTLFPEDPGRPGAWLPALQLTQGWDLQLQDRAIGQTSGEEFPVR